MTSVLENLKPQFPLGPISPDNGPVLIFDHGNQSEELQKIHTILIANHYDCSVVHNLDRLELLKSRLLLTTALDPESYSPLRWADFSEFFLIGVGEPPSSEPLQLSAEFWSSEGASDPFSPDWKESASAEQIADAHISKQRPRQPCWDVPTVEHIPLPLDEGELLSKLSYWSRFAWQLRRRQSFSDCPLQSQKNPFRSGLGLVTKGPEGFEFLATEDPEVLKSSLQKGFAITLNCDLAEFKSREAYFQYAERAEEDRPLLPIAILSSSPQRVLDWFQAIKDLPIKAIGLCEPARLRELTKPIAPQILLGDPDLLDDPLWSRRADPFEFSFHCERLWLPLTHRETEKPEEIRAFLQVALDRAYGQLEAARCRKILYQAHSPRNLPETFFPYEALGWDAQESSKLEHFKNCLQQQIGKSDLFHLKHQWDGSFTGVLGNVNFGWNRLLLKLWAQEGDRRLIVSNVTRCLLDYNHDYIGFMTRVSPNYHLPGININFDFRFPRLIEQTPTGCRFAETPPN